MTDEKRMVVRVPRDRVLDPRPGSEFLMVDLGDPDEMILMILKAAAENKTATAAELMALLDDDKEAAE